MNFTLNDDHRMLRDSAHKFLAAEVDLGRLLVPGADVGAVDQKGLWRSMAALGWPALVVPESYGGLGMDTVDLTMILRECGLRLATAPLFGTLAGTWALLAAGSEEQKQRLLPQVADGSLPLALAIAGPSGECEAGNPALSAQADGPDTVRLNGSANYVVDAGEAAAFVVAARFNGEMRWCYVPREQPGIAAQRVEWRDITREVCTLTFEHAQAELLPAPHGAAWPWVRDRLWLVLAAESAGGLQAVLDDTAVYARERVAFGKPIGSYQAIKHSLADMLAQSECTSTAVLYAAWALSQDHHPEATLAAAMAQSQASEAYREATQRSIQVFGAIGFTWEMKNHLYFKRARANAALLGSPAMQREVIAQALEARYPTGDTA
ncbi:MAG TPA: acyl-CoA dehydrogenase family protein [Ramlibacter sp.]|nr:acyl-CoA dehydrogenase family protein [Ramlibacter sp.]